MYTVCLIVCPIQYDTLIRRNKYTFFKQFATIPQSKITTTSKPKMNKKRRICFSFEAKVLDEATTCMDITPPKDQTSAWKGSGIEI